MARHLEAGSAAWIVAWASTLASCDGVQSALDPAGRGAERIANDFWWMTVGATVVWLAFVGVTIHAVHSPPARSRPKTTGWLVLGGGVVAPTIALAVLLFYGLATLPEHLAAAQPGELRIRIVGEQWWWRVQYRLADGGAIDLANELHLPVGEAVELELESPDVIHSFWVPALGGKVDMIPGRRTRSRLHPTRTGVFRGTCAEYCGDAHALMSFYVVVEEAPEFARWLARQAAPARAPTGPSAIEGRDLFAGNGCGACHTVRGTDADGVVGPDLTHVASRLSIAAGGLPTGSAAFQRWIAHTSTLKPNVLMPAFAMLPDDQLRALGDYLEQLE